MSSPVCDFPLWLEAVPNPWENHGSRLIKHVEILWQTGNEIKGSMIVTDGIEEEELVFMVDRRPDV